MATMTENPLRKTRKKHDVLSAGPKSYARLVTGPASHYFRLTALGWGGSLNALVGIVVYILWLKDYAITTESAGPAFALATLIALAITGFLGADELLRLHEEYMSTPDRTTTYIQDEHGIVSDGRPIKVNGVENAIVKRRDPKMLHGVMIRGDWLEKMDALIADGEKRFTRDRAGISGSRFGQVRAALHKAGYIDNGSQYTEEGIEWVRNI